MGKIRRRIIAYISERPNLKLRQSTLRLIDCPIDLLLYAGLLHVCDTGVCAFVMNWLTLILPPSAMRIILQAIPWVGI